MTIDCTDRQPRMSDDHPHLFLGLDVGAASVKLAVLDAQRQMVCADYRNNRGSPARILAGCLIKVSDRLPGAVFDNVCVTGSGRGFIGDLLGVAAVNEIIAHARAATHCYPHARSIIEIGGQDSKLIWLSEGRPDHPAFILDHRLNDICAAGTGSFLEQQAERLFTPLQTFGNIALSARRAAVIAGRCAVFAKSDITHLQNKGVPLEEIVAGLCEAVARNYLHHLARGRSLLPPIVFQGGVAANKGVVKAFRNQLRVTADELIVPEHCGIMGAWGAALIARDDPRAREFSFAQLIQRLREGATPAAAAAPHHACLTKPSAPHPQRRARADFDDGTFFMGVDTGSTSTSLVLLNQKREVVCNVYLETRGRPLEAVLKGLQILKSHGLTDGAIRGVGVTGSARELVAHFIGADVVKNEIICQAKGVSRFHPQVDKLFEIGGQDSKFIRLNNGAVVDFEMNKVCAAGTGSFLAEQAQKLNVDIENEFSRRGLQAETPAPLGSRCTVFMESDVVHHRQQGWSVNDILAGLSIAAVKNFLEKVVSGKPIGKHVVFSGGVASNASMVAAFNQLLGTTVTVAAYHKYTGAIGAAMEAGVVTAGGKSRFRGFHLKPAERTTETFRCDGCSNCCDIRKLHLQGAQPIVFGGICGRYETSGQQRNADLPPNLLSEYEQALLEDAPTAQVPSPEAIGIPRALLFYSLFVHWRTFFKALDIEIALSAKTHRRQVDLGLNRASAEACYPIKTVCGHVLDLAAKGVERIFLPCQHDMPNEVDDGEKNYNCPYVSALSVFVRASTDARLITPVFEHRNSALPYTSQLAQLGRDLGKSEPRIKQAIAAAQEAQHRFTTWGRARVRQVLNALPPARYAIVLLGKPYNLCDPALNLNVPQKLLRMGIVAIPQMMLPLDEIRLEPQWRRVVWHPGRQILRAAYFVKRDPRLFPIFITNFGCGPDAYLIKYARRILAEKPLLVLEIDEHASDVFILTRIEAFLDNIAAYRRRTPHRVRPVAIPPQAVYRLTPSVKIRRDQRVLHIPYMSDHTYAFELAFKSIGLDAKVLPPPDETSLDLGRRYSRGLECYPLTLVIGDLLKMIQDANFRADRAMFFWPANDEPCRWSQFPIELRQTLADIGLETVRVIAPISSMEKDQPSEVFGLNATRTWWRACLAIDMLNRLRLCLRSIESEPGGCDRVYHQALAMIRKQFLQSNHFAVIREALRRLQSVPVKTNGRRPVIGVIGGDYYLKVNSFANGNIFDMIETLGGTVCLSPALVDYVALQALRRPEFVRRQAGWIQAAWAFLRGRIQARDQTRIQSVFGACRAAPCDPPISDLIAGARPYVEGKMEPTLLFTVGQAKAFAENRVAGIINIIPFGCMIGNLASAPLARLQEDHDGIPIITLTFDGLKPTNQMTRIEAFMHQARRFAESHPAAGM
jgi:predicted CoA-substrate-specific enzyme activase